MLLPKPGVRVFEFEILYLCLPENYIAFHSTAPAGFGPGFWPDRNNHISTKCQLLPYFALAHKHCANESHLNNQGHRCIF